MDIPQWIRDIEARPCKCVSCHECKGSGSAYYAFPRSDRGGRYLGSSRWDDLDEMDTCETCAGSGITEKCDRCGELDDAYSDLEEQEERASRA